MPMWQLGNELRAGCHWNLDVGVYCSRLIHQNPVVAAVAVDFIFEQPFERSRAVKSSTGIKLKILLRQTVGGLGPRFTEVVKRQFRQQLLHTWGTLLSVEGLSKATSDTFHRYVREALHCRNSRS